MTSIEQTGISLIPDHERRGRPRDLGWLWAGTTLTMQTVLFGSFLPYFGLSLTQCVVIVITGNLLWVVVGYGSLQGVAAGTSIFAITRASFGIRGGRVPAALNWITQVLYETLGLSVIALAILALFGRAGMSTGGTGLKIGVVIVAAVVQLVLPLLGHRSIMTALRWMVPPFVVLFIVLTVLTAPKVSTAGGTSGGIVAILGGYALVLAGGSFAWVVNASDYSRYLPADSSPRAVVTAVSVGGFLSTTPMMILGAAVASIPDFGGDIISGLPQAFPAWFVVPYLLFVIAQNYGVNSVDMYSSSLTLQAVGLPLRQWQATAIDCTLSAALTVAVLLSPSFNDAIANIVLFVMVWIAPWAAIFLVDWALRRSYDREALFRNGSGPYWGTGGYRVPALIALVLGALATLAGINTSIWTGPLATALGGADVSIPLGFAVAGLTYWLGARREIKTMMRDDESVAPTFHVPTVDISSYTGLAGPGGRPATAAALDQACREVGFIQITGHGISAEVLAGLASAMDDFFGQSLEVKRSARTDLVNRGYTPPKSEALSLSAGVTPPDRMNDFFEAFNIGATTAEYQKNSGLPAEHYADNLWPDVTAFEPRVLAYFAEARRVARALTAGFADALGLPEGFFEPFTDHSIDVLRMNNYALPPGTVDLDGDLTGMGEHTDFGIVTVLWADRVAGLQVLGPDGSWNDVMPEPGALLVNLGDLMARWTGDRWVSTLHRVKPPVVAGRIERRRSAALFHDGNSDALISTLFAGRPYPPIRVDEHIAVKLAGSRGGVLNVSAEREAARIRSAAGSR